MAIPEAKSTILFSLPVEDLQTIITDVVDSCLKRSSTLRVAGPNPPEKLYTIKDLACMFQVSIATIRTLIKNRELAYVKTAKLIFVREPDLQKFLMERRQSSNTEIQLAADQILKNKKEDATVKTKILHSNTSRFYTEAKPMVILP